MTESVSESITLTSFSIICQHCRREIKRTQFPLQMHGVNLLSLRARLKPTHIQRAVMWCFCSGLVTWRNLFTSVSQDQKKC